MSLSLKQVLCFQMRFERMDFKDYFSLSNKAVSLCICSVFLWRVWDSGAAPTSACVNPGTTSRTHHCPSPSATTTGR